MSWAKEYQSGELKGSGLGRKEAEWDNISVYSRVEDKISEVLRQSVLGKNDCEPKGNIVKKRGIVLGVGR